MIFKQTEKFKLKAIFKPINRIYLFPVFVCLVLLFCPLIVIALDTWNTGYGVYSGTNKNVIVGSSAGPCYKVTNSDSSKDYFIPTKTIVEWNAFTAHKPATLSIGDCCAAGYTFNSAGACVQICPGGTISGTSCLYKNPGTYIFTVPRGATSMDVIVVGAGGGGGSRDHSSWHYYGGAGGGGALRSYTISSVQSFSLIVGAGGRPGSYTRWCNCSGVAGGTSSFNGTLIATGGKGGYTSGVSVSAAGGVGSGGTTNCTGGTGNQLTYMRANGGAGACGGGAGAVGSMYVGGGAGGGATILGGDGNTTGCGAGSGSNRQDGGDGCIRITWY